MADDVIDILGEFKMEATLRGNRPIDVTVRQLKLRELPKLADCIGDEAAMIAMCTDLLGGQIDELTLESAEKIVAECERLNMDFFQRWLERQLRRNEAVVPGVRQRIAATVESALRTTSQSSPSAAG